MSTGVMRQRTRNFLLLCASVWLATQVISPDVCAALCAADDPREATYRIEHASVRLRGGRCEREAPSEPLSRTETSLVGEPVSGDLNGDGILDAAVWLLHDPGGSGSFYYVAVALRIHGSYVGTNAVLVGDRIEPGAMHIRDGIVSVTYADRRPDESMSTRPTVGAVKHLRVSGGSLAEIR